MDYRIETSVSATTQAVGFHHWPAAPVGVHYLSAPHRHQFVIRVDLTVFADDREVEFHTLKRLVNSWLLDRAHDETGEVDFGAASCEMIAAEILGLLRLSYPGRDWYSVQVKEDDENGAVVEATRNG